jgi:antitoxin component YwqK of YwqJK toxin-antitoxin module
MVVIDCYRNTKGKMHGEYKTFTTEGTLIMNCSYHDGVLHGVKEDYHVFTHPPQRKSAILYEHGMMLSAIHYFDNGNIYYTLKYKEGKRHGPYIMYHKDGRIREQGEYNQNKKIKK